MYQIFRYGELNSLKNFKGKPSFKKWNNYCRRYGHSIATCRQKQQDNQNKPQKKQRTKQIILAVHEKRSKFTK